MMRALRLLLAAALLLAWQQALVHPLAHVDVQGAFVHLADDHGGRNGNGEEGKPEPLCDAIAAVATAVGSTPLAIDFPVSGDEASSARAAGNHPGPSLLAYRSQAPPQYS
jgi:hypothetical protein